MIRELRVLVICCLLLSLVLGGCGLLERGAHASPNNLVEAYLEAFKAGDFDSMVALSGGWEATPEELNFTRQLIEMIELKSYTIGEVVKLSDSEALVKVTLVMALLGHEDTQTDQIRVVKKDGKWFIEEGTPVKPIDG